MICLIAKAACNCAICAGVKSVWSSFTNPQTITPTTIAYYYNADQFTSFVNGNTKEPDGTNGNTKVDLSSKWFMRVNGGDFTKNVTGSIGDGYTMYSFQPSQWDSFTDYGSNYRFSACD